jgi:hypothetical protein
MITLAGVKPLSRAAVKRIGLMAEPVCLKAWVARLNWLL